MYTFIYLSLYVILCASVAACTARVSGLVASRVGGHGNDNNLRFIKYNIIHYTYTYLYLLCIFRISVRFFFTLGVPAAYRRNRHTIYV